MTSQNYVGIFRELFKIVVVACITQNICFVMLNTACKNIILVFNKAEAKKLDLKLNFRFLKVKFLKICI